MEPQDGKLTRRASKIAASMSTHEAGNGAADMRMDVRPATECASDVTATSSSDAFTRNTVRLVPIIPPHEILPGAMDVDMEWNRLVYLEPLMSVKKEIHRGKRAVSSQNNERSKEEDSRESQLTSPSSKYRLVALNRPNTLAHLTTNTTGTDKSLLLSSSSSTSASIVLPSHYLQPQDDKNKSNGSADRDEDDQIARLKQKIHLLPITDSDREEFWDAIKKHKMLQAHIHKSLVHNQSTPMGFNMEAAWSKTRAWIEKETLLVDAATEEYERRLVRIDQSQARKNKKPAMKKRNSANNPEKWLTLVDESIRTQVIKEYILEAEKDYATRFRQQEAGYTRFFNCFQVPLTTFLGSSLWMFVNSL
uniref:Uncharacterized protein n=1 Tax=Globisporangium ultimum (strain ATCC 200006 / CBS 805.95 / DAOM BR144) TaxID=431595 RepID=K3WQ07_GLOUD